MWKKMCSRVVGSWVLVAAISLALSPFAGSVRAEEPAPAAEDKPTANITTDFLSQYIFRGYALSRDSLVIQPSFTASYKGFSANVWGNLDTHESTEILNNTNTAAWNETDLTLSYTRTLYGDLSGTVGYVYYATKYTVRDTMEGYFGLSYALPWFNVAVTTYREFWHLPSWWLQFDVSRNFKLPWYDMSVDTGLSIGYLDISGVDYAEFHSGQLSAALNIPIGKYLTVSPKIGFAFALGDTASDNIKLGSVDRQSNHVFGGLRLTGAF